jgi:DNA-3-methyladenine glycosylase II
LRGAGLSGQKVSYVKNIARGMIEGILNPLSYSSIDEAEIIAELVTIKGIGVWTAEMFLIFTLGKQDVFSIGDLGLRNAIKLHYGDMSPAEMLDLSEKWSPYRSYASLILWKSLDNAPKTS